jgi:predicted AAA+ superfamily ATPase
MEFRRVYFAVGWKTAMNRYCKPFIYQDLEKKMVFIGGPRQVGKTTLSKSLCEGHFKDSVYLNWDIDEDRQAIMRKQWPQTSPLVIFDELHKYPKWKQWIKGVYDAKQPQKYLVTGSARLDVYRRGGDSLMGRYHYWRLHPFTLDELPSSMTPKEGFQRLLTLGGFPEPFLLGDEREARRWRRERFDRILKEDVRDLESVRNISMLALFVDALRERVGGMITLKNIAEDLQISPTTAKLWLSVIEKMYMAFAVFPLTQKVPRAILKPPKIYFYDNADVIENTGGRLENLVATTLLKRLHFIEDYYGYRATLHYIRDKEGREVDFVTVINGTITDLIEVKTSDSTISSHLKYYTKKLKPQRAIQLVAELKRSFTQDEITVTTPIEFFNNPPWKEASTDEKA